MRSSSTARSIAEVDEACQYVGQFRITREICERRLAQGISLNGVFFEYDKNLDVKKVRDGRGNLVGLLVGLAIDAQNECVLHADLTLPVSVSDTSFISDVEKTIYRFTGSWVFLLSTDKIKRVYLDACGSLSVVFDRARQTAASTTGLVLDNVEYVERFDGELHKKLAVSGLGWIPGGLTAHLGVERLLPNHFLDLQDWVVERHWPKTPFDAVNRVEELGDRIAKNIQSTLGALVKDGKLALSLTGGKDSRVLLAVCRDFIEDIDLLTVNLPGSQRDVFLAKRLAAIDSRMRHSVLPAIRSTETQRKAWLYKSSHCVGGVNQYFSGSLGSIACKYFLGGAAGEIGRGFLWRREDQKSTELDERIILGRLGLKSVSELETAVRRWLEGLKNFDAFTILDLAYNELRVGPWAFAQSYAYSGKGQVTHVSPFVSREVIECFLSLAPEQRRSDAYPECVIGKCWPELLKVEFNRYGDLRDFLDTMKKVINPQIVMRKFRKYAARA